jgi:integrase
MTPVVFHGTAREADVALAELITKASRGHVSVGARTVAEAVEAGLRRAEPEGLEPTTLRHYRTSAECYVLPALGTRRLAHLTAEHLDRCYGNLVEAGCSRSTVRGCHVLLCRVLDQAKRWGWVAVNVGRDARSPRQHTPNPKPVPIDVARSMIDEAAKVNPTLATLIVLAADTGARRGELRALRWRHVDEEASTLQIEAAIGDTNVPSWIHLHGLRHLQVTQLLDAGVPLRSVSGRVGHRNPSTTTNIYAHWIQESDARSAEIVEGRMWRSAPAGHPQLRQASQGW